MSFIRLIGLGLVGLSVLGLIGCASPTTVPTPMPTVITKPTVAPPPTPTPSSEACIKCHSDKETLKKLAVNKIEKSAETQGEG